MKALSLISVKNCMIVSKVNRLIVAPTVVGDTQEKLYYSSHNPNDVWMTKKIF